MSFETATVGCVSGQWREDDIAGNSLYSANDGVTCETTAARLVSPADRVVKLALGTVSKRCLICQTGNGSALATTVVDTIVVSTGYAGVSAQPTTPIKLVSDGVRSTTVGYVLIGNVAATDTKLRICDDSGTIYATSTSNISTTGMTQFAYMIDTITDTTNVRVAIWINNKLEAYALTGVARTAFYTTSIVYWGEYLGVGVSRAADLYLEHCYTRVAVTGGSATGVAADSPLVTPFAVPLLVGGGQIPPTSDAMMEQTPSTATPNSHNDVGTTENLNSPTNHPGYDVGTAGHIDAPAASPNGKRALFTFGAANPVPASPQSIPFVFVGNVQKLSGGGKAPNWHQLRMAGSQSTATTGSVPGTAYLGMYNAVANPSGAAFVRADFDQVTGTSTGTGLTTMDDSSVTTWETNQFAGVGLTCGTSTATIVSNTTVGHIVHGGWTGGTPSAGDPYTIATSKLMFGNRVPTVGENGNTPGGQVTSQPGPLIAYQLQDSWLAGGIKPKTLLIDQAVNRGASW